MAGRLLRIFLGTLLDASIGGCRTGNIMLSFLLSLHRYGGNVHNVWMLIKMRSFTDFIVGNQQDLGASISVAQLLFEVAASNSCCLFVVIGEC